MVLIIFESLAENLEVDPNAGIVEANYNQQIDEMLILWKPFSEKKEEILSTDFFCFKLD